MTETELRDQTKLQPLCGVCGRPGYRTEVGRVLTVVGHLDQRIKHAFEEDRDPTAAEVWRNVRPMVESTAKEDPSWSRGAGFMRERADAALAERDRLIASIRHRVKLLPPGELRDDIERAMALAALDAEPLP